MRRPIVLVAFLFALIPTGLVAGPPIAGADTFNVNTTLTYLGQVGVGGQQRYRFDYVLSNTVDPLGLTAFRTFFNSDPITHAPSGDRATFVSFGAPDAWGGLDPASVTVFDKNASGQWLIEWNYDFVSPPGPLELGQELAGFAVVFDWNDPTAIPPYQHAEASNGSSYDGVTTIVELVGMTGTIGGTVTASCEGATQPAAGVAVMLLHDSQPYLVTTTGAAGTYGFSDIPLGTYTVVITPPPGYGTGVDNQIVSLETADQGVSADFAMTCQLGTINGLVTGTCNGSTPGLQGVTVDLFGIDGSGHDVLLAVTATDASGAFSFPNVALGDYNVVIVTPLGFSGSAGSQIVHLTTGGAPVSVSFGLTCRTSVSAPRTIGYWKHQVNVYLTGKGKAQESLSDLLGHTDRLLLHFNENIVNPVVIFVPNSNIPGDRLRKLEKLLTVNVGGTMLDRAKQQLLALLLNVVAGYIPQTQVISPNGATVSQAITHANDLIQDGLASNDETAKTIADTINNGLPVPSGMVPVSTRIITYHLQPVDGPPAFCLDLAAPNPTRGAAVAMGFSLTRSGRAELRVYDVNGRSVRTLASGTFEAGPYRMTWDGTSESGARVSPGIYFYRLVTGEGTLTRSVAVQR